MSWCLCDDPQMVDWKSRSGWVAAWELYSRARPLRADIYVLDSHMPQEEESAAELALIAREKMLRVLVEKGNYINE